MTWTLPIWQVTAPFTIPTQNGLFPLSLFKWANRAVFPRPERLATMVCAPSFLMGRSALVRRLVVRLSMLRLVLRTTGRLMSSPGTRSLFTVLSLPVDSRCWHLLLFLKLFPAPLLNMGLLTRGRFDLQSCRPHLIVDSTVSRWSFLGNSDVVRSMECVRVLAVSLLTSRRTWGTFTSTSFNVR